MEIALSSPLTIVALVWVIWGIWRGCRKGFAKVAVGLLGLLIGYIAVIIWVWPLSAFLGQYVGALWQWPLASIILFMVSALAVQLVAMPLLKKRQFGVLNTTFGGIGNGLFAIVSLLILVWAGSLIQSLQPQSTLVNLLAKVGVNDSHFLVKISQRFVAASAGMGMRLWGVDKAKAQHGVALISNPAQSLQSIQAVTQSDETKTLLQNADIQEAIKVGDSNTVMAHPAFVAFSQQPGMEELSVLMPSEPGQSQDEALAKTFTNIYRRMDTIKQSPEIQAALADLEVHELIRSGDSARLLTHPKTQPIVAVIMAELTNPSGSDSGTGTDTGKGESNHVSGSAQEPGLNDTTDHETAGVASNPMYKWQDDKGQTNFSTWDQIPKEKREGAELLLFK